MIEGPGGPPSSRNPLRGFSMERVTDQLRAWAEAVRRWVLPPQEHLEASDPLLWRLRLAERIFWVVLGGLGVYLIVDLVFVHRRPPSLASRPSGAPQEPHEIPVDTGPEMKSPAAYQETLVLRNPFGLTGVVAGQSEQEAAKSKLKELTSKLTVVGINRGRVPEALIEDTEAQRTYFVKVGDEINGLTVKAIDQQGVLLGYDHEETRLQ